MNDQLHELASLQACPTEIPQVRLPDRPTDIPRTRRHSAAHPGTPVFSRRVMALSSLASVSGLRLRWRARRQAARGPGRATGWV